MVGYSLHVTMFRKVHTSCNFCIARNLERITMRLGEYTIRLMISFLGTHCVETIC